MIESYQVSCPYCGETYAAIIDVSVEQQDYIEDCEVCCRPILFNVSIDLQARLTVEIRREDDV